MTNPKVSIITAHPPLPLLVRVLPSTLNFPSQPNPSPSVFPTTSNTGHRLACGYLMKSRWRDMEVPIPGPRCETSINLKQTLTPLITVSIVQPQIPLSLSFTRAMAGRTITITADNLSQVNNSITPLQVITNPTNPVPDIRWDHRLLMAILQGSDLKVLEGIPTPTPRLLGHWAITDPAIRLDRKAMVINQVGEAPQPYLKVVEGIHTIAPHQLGHWAATVPLTAAASVQSAPRESAPRRFTLSVPARRPPTLFR
ncbi:hypothetical protein H4Q26_009119 [Puccinia striiformis f. sp. tritici PST-130]|nr:hypothetical protein H4Q26_009119 [Puccinia striiformis f. sp. tritici PST-130]